MEDSKSINISFNYPIVVVLFGLLGYFLSDGVMGEQVVHAFTYVKNTIIVFLVISGIAFVWVVWVWINLVSGKIDRKIPFPVSFMVMFVDLILTYKILDVTNVNAESFSDLNSQVYIMILGVLLVLEYLYLNLMKRG